MSAADFTIADVLAWARTKPARRRYEYFSDRCAMGQFLTETGRATKPTMGGDWWRNEGESFPDRHEFDRRLDEAAVAKPRTLGAFVKRLEQEA